MRIPSWLDAFVSELETEMMKPENKDFSAEGDLVCFESVDVPCVGIRRYVETLWKHFGGLKTWAAMVFYMQRFLTVAETFVLNEYTGHRVVLSCLAVAAHKCSIEGVGVLEVAGPGGVDTADLSAMVRVLSKTVKYNFTFTPEELSETVSQLAPKSEEPRSIHFAAVLLKNDIPRSVTEGSSISTWISNLPQNAELTEQQNSTRAVHRRGSGKDTIGSVVPSSSEGDSGDASLGATMASRKNSGHSLNKSISSLGKLRLKIKSYCKKLM
eukprot:TRINITY_DN1525_c1_g2_i1.p1 TRINITY_DN1525_c1_g2~~TRINITY_DN1525_c1_g2_i1.p1  ORF type:complete len:269 (+),score=37.46 TRINITY_DN1525_c1_g2_i1:55-861(+)